MKLLIMHCRNKKNRHKTPMEGEPIVDRGSKVSENKVSNHSFMSQMYYEINVVLTVKNRKYFLTEVVTK